MVVFHGFRQDCLFFFLENAGDWTLNLLQAKGVPCHWGVALSQWIIAIVVSPQQSMFSYLKKQQGLEWSHNEFTCGHWLQRPHSDTTHSLGQKRVHFCISAGISELLQSMLATVSPSPSSVVFTHLPGRKRIYTLFGISQWTNKETNGRY